MEIGIKKIAVTISSIFILSVFFLTMMWAIKTENRVTSLENAKAGIFDIQFVEGRQYNNGTITRLIDVSNCGYIGNDISCMRKSFIEMQINSTINTPQVVADTNGTISLRGGL